MAETGAVAGLVLAAGLSSRMGGFKPLLPFGNGTLIESAVDSLLKAGVRDVVLVTGHRADEIEPLFAGAECVRTVFNPDYRLGMFTSVKAGLRAVSEDRGAFLMMPGDCPGVLPDTVKTVVEGYHRTGAPIVVPVFEGRRGHPALFSIRYRAEILSSDPPDGMRSVLSRHSNELLTVETGDSGVLTDIDVKADYDAAAGRVSVRRED